jgi:hypothetical protein
MRAAVVAQRMWQHARVLAPEVARSSPETADAYFPFLGFCSLTTLYLVLDELGEDVTALSSMEVLSAPCVAAIQRFVFDIFLRPPPPIELLSAEEIRSDGVYRELSLYLAPEVETLARWLSLIWEDAGVRVKQAQFVVRLAGALCSVERALESRGAEGGLDAVEHGLNSHPGEHV